MIDARDEAIRKAMHLAASLGAAAVVYLLPPIPAATALAAATAVALSVELGRRTGGRFGAAFHRLLGPLLRDREGARLTGATTLAIGYTAAATLFPGTPALAAILVVGVGDAAAAVVGRRFGRLRYPGGKSVEGSVVFLVVALIITRALLPGTGLGPVAVLSLALTAAEAPSLPFDDNLYLPPLTAAAVHALILLTGPAFFS